MLNLKVPFSLSACILLFPRYGARREAQSNEDTRGDSSHLYKSLEEKQLNQWNWENIPTGKLFGGSANEEKKNDERTTELSRLFCAHKGVSCDGNNLPSENLCALREYQNANRCGSAHKRKIQLNDICPYGFSDGNSTLLLYTNGGTMKQTSKWSEHKFDQLFLLLRNIIPSRMARKEKMTQRRHKYCITVRGSETSKSVFEFLEDGSMNRNVGTYHTWYKEDTDRLFAYQGEVKRMMSAARKSRILNEACTLNCGTYGTCKMNSGLQYCNCKPGYSMDIKNNFICKEHCSVNNGGCDPDAVCTPLDPPGEITNGVIKNVGVLCKCKNGNTKHMGYYCNSGYFTSLNLLLLLFLLLYWCH
ncbi:hypothetical protein C922_03837 [Plasmodium inui San Antonio 1]|uniref:Uncharacterized protein n=1 Tax=Plasmodium inui San Antonio 1 TaxID=1237626 RepID=W7A9N4_9APIC|nr:hypothetical protein C922_03837 [Plasmodium inui San Antonio 1]EUD65854.1 hypothetical protein C922_03837 [Plasmodium inui San Antonio 1]